MVWFDESRLDDPGALAGADARLRSWAESGSRVRREVAGAAEVTAAAVAGTLRSGRPRAVVAAGPDSRLLRAVLEPTCPVPFVAWPHAGLPGWVGALDLVVVLAPDGSDPGAASAVAEAGRRGAHVIAACPAASLVGEHLDSRYGVIIPTSTRDQLAVAVVVLDVLAALELGPRPDPESVAVALDDVAVACSPHRDIAVNPAKELAIALADAAPLVWGGSVLAARAARRVAESLRRASGRSAIADDAEHLVPVIEATPARDVFSDPFADPTEESLRPALVVLDDGNQDPVCLEQRRELVGVADARGVRVEVIESQAPTDVGRYASLLLQGTYAAEYLRIGLVPD